MKRYTVIFSAVAIDNIEQTVGYYEKQQTGLGKRFAEQLLLTLKPLNETLSLPPCDTMISGAPL